ncbi:MAG: helix-turn-helix transcriptional regulator [Oscillospiraceae bacterium]
MEKINNEQFGEFLSQLRKEKSLTQKQLAEKLYISDKAVSKWECGLSLPDISLLMPLAKILDVTTTELLSGQKIASEARFSVEEVDHLMSKTIALSEEDLGNKSGAKKSRKRIFFFCLVIFSIEILFLILMGNTGQSIFKAIGTVELLLLIFGGYFTFFVKETLPVYYDENNISFYHDGVMRMNVVGLRLNNSNWSHILKAAQMSAMGGLIIFPMIYGLILFFSPKLWEGLQMILTFAWAFGCVFLPIYVVGKKYE